MFRRSSHIAVHVPREKIDEAARFYRELFALGETRHSETSIELKGTNFTIWIDLSDDKPAVLQEFVVKDADAARAAVESSGAKIIGESEFGFYVADPYGLAYHVYVDDRALALETQ